jgi:hypothetical protein
VQNDKEGDVKKMIQLIVNSDLSKEYFSWLDKDMKKGEALNIELNIPVIILPIILSDINIDGESYKMFMTEQIGDDYYVYANSIDNVTIKIGNLKKKISIEYLSFSDIEPKF